jgi:hypothetical protein
VSGPPPTTRIVELDGTPTLDLDSFLSAAKRVEVSQRSAFERVMLLGRCPRVMLVVPKHISSVTACELGVVHGRATPAW